MERLACATIKGFYYQFLYAVNLCLDILKDSGTGKILCEGIEDIDKIAEDGKTCIQVKTSISTIGITSKSFKKSILNFYKEYLNNKEITFVFHTNAKPGTSRIDGLRDDSLNKWAYLQRKGWNDVDKTKEVLTTLKKIIDEYIKVEGIIGIDLTLFDEEFIKHIHLEFDNPESSVYEDMIRDKLKDIYPSAHSDYIELLLTNLVHLVIKKSISGNTEDRYINFETIKDVVSRTTESLNSAYQDIILTDEEGTVKLSLNDVVSKLNNIYDNTENILNNTESLVNANFIEMVEMPPANEIKYEEFPFVVKLSDAKIPPRLVFDAKNNFYQTEYALQKAEIFESNTKTKELSRLKTGVKNIYIDEYELAKAEKLKSIQLLIKTNKEIKNQHHGILASAKLGFDWFHKIGLMHHVSNEDIEIIWEVKK